MRILSSLLAVLALVLTSSLTRAGEPSRGLDIYFIDTEGGAATLVVTPLGESVLLDCGNAGSRDPERIYKVATAAGLKAIDYLILTHWHADHYGGVARLAELIPVHHYYDRGFPKRPPSATEDPSFPLLIDAYKRTTRGKSRVLRPGDEIPLKQTTNNTNHTNHSGPPLRLVCLCGAGDIIPDRPGAPENPIAREHRPHPDDPTDNANSLGLLLSYGGFRFLDLGDLTWNIEYKLVHPTDKIGPVDVYQVTHHGLDLSNNPVLIKTVRPRVAICNNGPRKGANPSVIATLRRVPSVQAIYQLHRNVLAGSQENTDPDLIANPDEQCQAECIKLAVAPDSKHYTVTVGGTGKTRRFETRQQ